MFICKPCLDKDETCRYGFVGHLAKSHGQCEVCDKVAECADCKCHHLKVRVGDSVRITMINHDGVWRGTGT